MCSYQTLVNVFDRHIFPLNQVKICIAKKRIVYSNSEDFSVLTIINDATLVISKM